MSKTKEITITLTRLIQTAPYESLEFSIAETLELSSKDNVSKVRSEKLDELNSLVTKKEKEIRKQFKTK